MKRSLFLLALLCVCLCEAAVWERELLISTRNTSLMLTAGEGESLKFAYYGDRIDDMERNRIHEAWIGLNKDAYPVFGTTCNFAHAMQVTHADGNMTLDLVVSNVARETTERGEHIAIVMKDRLYPFEVTVHYNTLYNDDIIESWIEVVHNEKKPVVLYRFDSSYMPIRRSDVWVSHLHGAWTAETILTSEPLENGLLEIRNTDGARNAHYAHPELMFSLDGR
ncbi:MAG: alpha-galactosidase, partial [Bacteroidaceae bacterium]|nr:alpha-galactosidase [Bacteroidaceae bacterium]